MKTNETKNARATDWKYCADLGSFYRIDEARGLLCAPALADGSRSESKAEPLFMDELYADDSEVYYRLFSFLRLNFPEHYAPKKPVAPYPIFIYERFWAFNAALESTVFYREIFADENALWTQCDGPEPAAYLERFAAANGYDPANLSFSLFSH